VELITAEPFNVITVPFRLDKNDVEGNVNTATKLLVAVTFAMLVFGFIVAFNVEAWLNGIAAPNIKKLTKAKTIMLLMI